MGLTGGEFEVAISGVFSTTLVVLSTRVGLRARFSVTGAGAGVSFGGAMTGLAISGAAAGLGWGTVVLVGTG